MDKLQFIRDISWQVVILFGLLTLLVYYKPLSNFISNLRKGKVDYDPKSGKFSGDVEVGQQTSGSSIPEDLNQTFLEKQNDTQDKKELEIIEAQPKESWLDLYGKGEYQKAYEAIKTLINSIDKNNGNAQNVINWLTSKSLEILCKIDFEKGTKEFEKYILDNSENLFFYHTYFDVLEETGNLSKIYLIIDNYSGSKKNKYVLLYRKAEIMIRNSETDKAINIIDEIISQTENINMQVDALILKGNIYKKENIEEAKRYYFAAYKREPRSYQVLNSLADAFQDFEDASLELFFRIQLLEIEKNVRTWGLLGNVYLRLNLINHALIAYEKANEISLGEADWIIANIGNLYNNVKLHKKAIEYLNAANSMNLSNEYTTNRLSSAIENDKKEENRLSDLLDQVKLQLNKVEM